MSYERETHATPSLLSYLVRQTATARERAATRVVAGKEVDRLARERMRRQGIASYRRALYEILRERPELARRYATGEE